jgi:hypothetical protein
VERNAPSAADDVLETLTDRTSGNPPADRYYS